LRLAKENQPDAITLNMLTPGKSGWETLYELKNDETTKHIAVIIVSIVDNKRMGFALGAADYIVKPVSRDVLLEKIRKHVKPADQKPSKVLVVDDDPTSFQLASEVLSSSGFTTLGAKDGKEAVTVLESEPVDCVLLDLIMPEMDGFQVLKWMSGRTRFKRLPVFVLTAKDLSREEIALLDRNTRGTFHKGSEWREELVQQLQTALDGKL
jgi:DNA-binding response OmpR family regulator